MNYPYAIQQKKSGVCPIFLLILHFKTQYDMTHRPLYIIPARGGSKGIPRKNIRPLAGRPLIAYSIDVTFQGKLPNKQMGEGMKQYIARGKVFAPNIASLQTALHRTIFITIRIFPFSCSVFTKSDKQSFSK